MASFKLKIGDLVRFSNENALLGVIIDVCYYSKTAIVLKKDGTTTTYNTYHLKRYTVDRSLSKVVSSLIKTLENVDEWVDDKKAIYYFMESMNEENNKKVGD